MALGALRPGASVSPEAGYLKSISLRCDQRDWSLSDDVGIGRHSQDRCNGLRAETTWGT